MSDKTGYPLRSDLDQVHAQNLFHTQSAVKAINVLPLSFELNTLTNIFSF